MQSKGLALLSFLGISMAATGVFMMYKVKEVPGHIVLYYVTIFLFLGLALLIAIIFLSVRRNTLHYKPVKEPITETKFQSTLDKMLEGVEILGFDYRYLYVNDAYEKQVRFTKAELLGHTVMEKFPGIEKTAIFKAIQQCLQERIVIHVEEEFTFPDDHRKACFEISFQPIPEGVFILSIDITDRKRKEEYLIQSERRFRALIENNNDIMRLSDENLKPIYRSSNLERITGWKSEEIEKEGDVAFAHPDDREKLIAYLKEVKSNPGKVIPLAYRFRHKDGHYLFMEGTATNLLHDEAIRGIVSNFSDVTKKREADEKIYKLHSEISQREERFRNLIENSYDIVSIIDKNLKPLYRSPAFTRITGWQEEDLKEKGSAGQTHPDDVAKVRDTLNDVMNSHMVPFPITFRTKHKDGHYIFMEGIITNMLQNESIKGIVSNFRDVTDRKNAEEKIKQSEKIYKTIASNIPGSVVCMLDKDYRYLFIEGDMLELMGHSKENILGRKAIEVLTTIRYTEVLPYFMRVFKGESFTIENFRRGFDIISRFAPIRDENNNVYAALIVIFDVSELKKAQRSVIELNVSLEQKIKERTLELEIVNKELESFSYSVAHDLRSPLRAVNGYASMLEEDHSRQLGDEPQRLIREIKHNTKKMGMLIDDLLTFSKLGRKQVRKTLTDMQQIAEASLKDMHFKEGYPGKIVINKLHSVMADPSLLKLVMVNLISNAIKYSSKQEKPLIEISSELNQEEIIYYVKDNGVGFDMKFVDKLFGVFQRLHSEQDFEGTGVGLAIVERIIHRHGGLTGAISQVGEGATFYFSLPLVSEI